MSARSAAEREPRSLRRRLSVDAHKPITEAGRTRE